MRGFDRHSGQAKPALPIVIIAKMQQRRPQKRAGIGHAFKAVQPGRAAKRGEIHLLEQLHLHIRLIAQPEGDEDINIRV